MSTVYLGLEWYPPRQCNSQEQQRLPELPLRHIAAQQTSSFIQPPASRLQTTRKPFQASICSPNWVAMAAEASKITVNCRWGYYIGLGLPTRLCIERKPRLFSYGDINSEAWCQARVRLMHVANGWRKGEYSSLKLWVLP
jgi:hypothetical protein